MNPIRVRLRQWVKGRNASFYMPFSLVRTIALRAYDPSDPMDLPSRGGLMLHTRLDDDLGCACAPGTAGQVRSRSVVKLAACQEREVLCPYRAAAGPFAAVLGAAQIVCDREYGDTQVLE